jgi:hypothetical protein
MPHSSVWEAVFLYNGGEIFSFTETKFHYRTHESPTVDPPVHRSFPFQISALNSLISVLILSYLFLRPTTDIRSDSQITVWYRLIIIARALHEPPLIPSWFLCRDNTLCKTQIARLPLIHFSLSIFLFCFLSLSTLLHFLFFNTLRP